MLEFGKVEWADALRDFPESAIDRGLDRARSECRMPPSPAEFRELCRRDPSHEVFRALPRPKDPDAEEKGRQALAEMRRMLGREAG